MANAVIDEFVTRAHKSEEEINELEEDVKLLKKCKGFNDEDGDVEEMRNENAKLKYQLGHLKKSLDKENIKLAEVQKDYATSFKSELTEAFQKTISAAYPSLPSAKALVTHITNSKFGDYQCNSAMTITGMLKMQGIKTNPREVAQNLINLFEGHLIVEKVDVAGAGFINIHLDRSVVSQKLTELLFKGVRPPYLGPSRKVLVDMSSPNIAKEMHVGHLRSTIIGEAIARFCSFIGHNVKKINHLGDWGTQFGMLIAHLQDKFPDYKTVSPPINDLQAFYKESKVRFDQDEIFKEKAYACVVKLQSFDDDTTTAWNLICKESRKEFVKIYKRLGIENLIDRGESFYQPLMKRVVDEMHQKGMLEFDNGRYICWAPGCETPMTIVKTDGGFTYDTSDMAALHHRLSEEKADWIVYVIDSGQSTHMQAIFSAGEKIGWYKRGDKRLEFIGFGVVLGEDKKKFKTRSGEVIRLADLLDEGMKRSLDTLKEKNRHQVLNEQELRKAQEAVAYGCIKYADLSHSRLNDYLFSFDKMLDDKGNTAVYLLYAYMRIRAISRAANISNEDVAGRVGCTQILLDTSQEFALARHVCQFTEVIEKIVEDMMMHTLCEYLYSLATCFSDFYDCCYVVEKDKQTGKVVRINWSRVMLCEATARTLKAGFDILGIATVEKM